MDISKKTWARAVEPVLKIGYMNGAADGQIAVFQSCFDMGYAQGLNFGLELGVRKTRMQEESSLADLNIKDTQKLNCQICLNGITAQENIVNLFNIQQENNIKLLGKKDYKKY